MGNSRAQEVRIATALPPALSETPTPLTASRPHMTPTNPTDNDAISDARAVLEKATANRTQLERRLREARESITPLTADIAKAMAAGDDTKAAELSAKRARAQGEIPDLTRAVELASKTAEEADVALARLEVGPLSVELEDTCRRFVGLIASANAVSSGIMVQMQRYQSRFSRADFENPGADPRSGRNILARSMSPLARRLFNELRDYRAD